ncbi:hypothetical protein SRIMM317S_00630 [Streptomyces rimosus subsp. rimosus]
MTKATTYSCAIVRTWHSAASGTLPIATARTTSVRISSGSRRTRSTQAPAGRPMSRNAAVWQR